MFLSKTFRERFDQEMDAVFGEEIEDLIRLGLLERTNSPLPYGKRTGEVPQRGMMVRLTRRGRLLGNQAFMRFV